MKITSDLHIHTSLSKCAKAEATVAFYMDKARELGLKTLGFSDHLWDSAIPNANSFYRPQHFDYISQIKPELEAMGYTVSEFKFTDTNDVTAVTQAAAAASDVIYIPTDNTAASCTETIYGAMTGNKTPIVAGEEGICKGCGVATLSISYYDLGYATGKMAAKILKGEAKIAEMPIEYASATTKKYNPVICADLGITPPTGYEAIVIEEAQ